MSLVNLQNCFAFRFCLKDAEDTVQVQMWLWMMSRFIEEPVQVFFSYKLSNLGQAFGKQQIADMFDVI